MGEGRAIGSDDRAVSVAVTHVLTIGIATVLLSGLLIGAAGTIEGERDRAADRELRTVGERLSTELLVAAQRGSATDADEIVLGPGDRDTVLGGGYRVELASEGCDDDLDHDGCLTVVSDRGDRSIRAPVAVPEGIDVEAGTARGGSVAVVYEDDDGESEAVTIRGAGP